MAITTIQTLAQRQAIIRKRLLESNPNEFSTAPGSVIGNLFMAPLAVGDVQQQARTYLVAVGESILDILALEKDQTTLELLAQALNTTVSDVLTQLSGLLDAWGGNFGETRLTPTKSSGIATFSRLDPPQQDITIGIGKIVETGGGIRYTVTAPNTMFVANAGDYLDQDNLFSLNVPVEALDTGSAGNVPADSLTKISTPVDGLPFISNSLPMTGGRDLENDNEFGARLLLKWQAFGRLTVSGINFYARSLVQGIQDVYVARTGDPLSLRGDGRADVWFKGEALTQFTDVFGAYNHPTIPNAVVPTKKPVLSLISVSNGSAVLRRDTESTIAGSVQSLDYIQFTTDPGFPAAVSVTYFYNAQVETLQNVYNDEQYAPLAQQEPTTPAIAVRTPILAKEALVLNMDYSVKIMVNPDPSLNPATVRNNVRVALALFSESLTLGETVFLSDLNEVVESVSGVLRISGLPIKFAPTGQSGVFPEITTVLNQYGRLLNINIF